MVQVSDFPDRYDEAEAKARALIEEAKGLQGPAPPLVSGVAGASGTVFQNVFYSYFRQADNRVLRHVYTPNVGWSHHDMAGSVASAPAVINFRDDMWVFARRPDNLLTYRVHNGSAWGDWLWKPGQFSGAPAASRAPR